MTHAAKTNTAQIVVENLNPLSFPLHGVRLIEASAGTGKTWTLTALYLRLVLQHGAHHAFQRPLLPPEILVVTFTEAATQELRDRIRKRLALAARCFAKSSAADDSFINQLLAEYPESEHEKCALLLAAAARWMDEAAIFTIHGFCKRVLTQYAFLTGAALHSELEQNINDLQLQAVRDYWRHQLYPLSPALVSLAAAHWQSPDAMKRRLLPLMEKKPDTDNAPALAVLLQQEQQRIEAQQQAITRNTLNWAQELRTLFEAAWEADALPRSKPSRSSSILGWLEKIEAWANDNFEGDIPYTKATLAAFQPDAIHDAAKDATHPAVKTLMAHPAFAVWAQQHSNQNALSEETCSAIDQQAAHWIGNHLATLKQRQNTQGFDDLLRDVQTALQGAQGSTLATRLTEQFPFALVDEFQDTDPIQFSIFSTLYQQQPNSPVAEKSLGFCMIGDPKQAIYAFRGADIHTYLKARQSHIDGIYQLDTNFRSSASLVTATNRIFELGKHHAQGPFLLGEQIPFVSVNASGDNWQLIQEDEPQPAHQFWVYDDNSGNAISSGRYREALAERTASFICRLLNSAEQQRSWLQNSSGDKKPLKPADIAILVKDFKEARAIRQALLARQLASVYLSQKDSVFDTQEAQDMLGWLRALAEPQRESLVRAALASRTLQQDYRTLDSTFNQESRWEETLALFADCHQCWHERGILPALQRLIHHYQLPARLLQQQDERALTNVLHLAEILQQAAQEQDGPHALIHWFEKTLQQIANGNGGDDSYQIRLESDEALIRVVTIHKSKGLEYPLVFLPFACSFRPASKRFLPVRYLDDNQQPVIDYYPTDAALARADRERLAEDLRLLYVALTRARYHCWVGMAPVASGNSKQNQLELTALGYLLNGGAEIENSGLRELLEKLADATLGVSDAPDISDDIFVPQQENNGTREALKFSAAPPTRWHISSFSALKYQAVDEAESAISHSHFDDLGEHATQVAAATTAPANGIYAFPRGARAGSLLHDALEWLALQGFSDTAVAALDDWSGYHTLNPEQQHTLQHWLKTLLHTPLQHDSQLTLQGLQKNQYLPEMEFWLAAEQVSLSQLDQLIQQHCCPDVPRPRLERDRLNGMLKGFIDLTLELDGRYWVLDYKSNHLGNSAADYHPQAITEKLLEARYDVQCALYLLALHRLLKNRLPHYTPQQHLGGAMLWFIRGIEHPQHGLFQFDNVGVLACQLDALFSGEEVTP